MEDIVKIKESNTETAEEQQELSPWKAYFQLWSYASPLDLFLRLLGAAAALGGGSAYPLMTLIFGSLVNAFNDRAVGLMSPADFRAKVNHQSLWFVFLFIGKFGVSICVIKTPVDYDNITNLAFVFCRFYLLLHSDKND